MIYDIAIVGLGATGVSLLRQIRDELYKKDIKKPNIAVFNPHESFAKGNAFGDADIIHKLNTPLSMMSVASTEPHQFSYWLNSNYGKSDEWAPRLRFSEFISQTYEDIKSSKTIRIDEWKCHVSEIFRSNTGFTLKNDHSDMINASKVVLCLGSITSDTFPEFKHRRGFYTHFSEYNHSSKEPLIVVGSGLTAIDAFRYIHSRSDIDVHMISRNGYIPTCITSENSYIPVHLTFSNIINQRLDTESYFNVFTRLLLKELSVVRSNGEFWPAMKLLRQGRQTDYLNFLLNRARHGNLPCQDILVSTRNYMHHLWCLFTLEEKKIFMQKYSALWMAWRHPIPQDVFSELIESSRRKKLTFHRAVSPPTYRDNAFNVQTEKRNLSSTRLWDATGGGITLCHIKQSLINNLLNRKLVEEYPCGGINVDTTTFQCIVRNKKISGLHNIGPLNKGKLFSTNAFWFNAKCAEALARSCVADFYNHY